VWVRRYEELGVAGLRDRSSRPHLSPKATTEEVVGKIIYLRQNYHFGPHKIAMHLKRYHEIEISSSGVWRILKRLGMSRLPSSQRYKRPLSAKRARHRRIAPESTLERRAISSFPRPSAAHSSARACTTLRCASDEEVATRCSSLRWESVSGSAAAVMTGTTTLYHVI
jgi:transposase